MAYDQNSKLFRPDFQAPQLQMPDWLPMGEDQGAPAISPFVDALKNHMTPTSKDAAMPDVLGKAGAAGGGGGGMKSL